MRQLVLASSSRYRRELLARLGLHFEWEAPPYEESLPAWADPRDLVREQATGKARSLRSRFPDALVIGSDQVVSLEDRILGKPGSVSAAIDQLRQMSGREHQLVTAVAVFDAANDRLESHVELTPIALRDLTVVELERYVKLENPIDCAGSYKSEGLGVTLFEYQRGDDPTAVVGLPLIALCRLLRSFGVDPLTGR